MVRSCGNCSHYPVCVERKMLSEFVDKLWASEAFRDWNTAYSETKEFFGKHCKFFIAVGEKD